MAFECPLSHCNLDNNGKREVGSPNAKGWVHTQGEQISNKRRPHPAGCSLNRQCLVWCAILFCSSCCFCCKSCFLHVKSLWAILIPSMKSETAGSVMIKNMPGKRTRHFRNCCCFKWHIRWKQTQISNRNRTIAELHGQLYTSFEQPSSGGQTWVGAAQMAPVSMLASH